MQMSEIGEKLALLVQG